MTELPPSRVDEIDTPSGYLFWDTLRFIRMGRMDPSVRLEKAKLCLARWYRTGAATVELIDRGDKISVRVWGEAADEAMAKVPELLGLHDTPVRDFGHAKLNRMLRPVLELRLSRAPYLSHTLPTHILQQKIAWRDAALIWRRLVSKHGASAPGPHGLKMPLSFEQLRHTPRAEYIAAGLSPSRIPLLREIGRLGHRIDTWYEESIEGYAKKVQTLPQMGPWTTFHALGLSMGEPDVVVTGDYALPHTVAFALIGKPRSNDQEMLQLLEPFSGNRWRLVRLIWALNIVAPRRGPRMPPSGRPR